MAKKNTNDATDHPPSFEEAMQELERIVEELESGELTLEQSLARYERGVQAARRCRQVLDDAEKKLQMLVSDEQGTLREEPFKEEQ